MNLPNDVQYVCDDQVGIRCVSGNGRGGIIHVVRSVFNPIGNRGEWSTESKLMSTWQISDI